MRKWLASLLLVTLLGITACALGDTIQTDWSIGTGGTVSFSSGASITGSNLSVNSVQLVDNNVAGATLNITDGLLSFSDSNSTGPLSWGNGGTLSITGCITSGACTNPETLLSDDFQSVTVVPISGTLEVTFGEVSGIISSDVASAFGGIDTSFAASSFDITLSGSSSPYLPTYGSIDAVAATEYWNLSTSLLFLGLIGGIFGMLTRAKVLRILLPV